jgi:DNA-binding transcriptional ArsR family regulator
MKARKARPAMSPEALELVAARFRALGEPLRLRIIQELERGERGVSELTESVGAGQPNVSKHLRVLQDAGLVKRRTLGNTARYSVADEMVFELCDLVCSRLRTALEAQVGALTARPRAYYR